MSFPRYPKYKPSGVDWLGDVPEHWEVVPLKHFAEIDSCGSYGVEPNEESFVLPVATTAQIDPDGRFNVDAMPRRGFSHAEAKRFGCSVNDILIVKSSGSATNIISGKAGLVDERTPPFVFSNFLMRVRPIRNLADARFVYAELRSHLTRQRVELMCSTTTYPNLQIGEYTSAALPLPPLAEQQAIAEFLDQETAKIDSLIEDQRRLIELLKEKRQAVISHAVTRGLNPDAPLKPSGIGWLGELPEYWKTPPLYMRYSIELGKMLDSSKLTGDHAVPYLRNVDVQWNEINLDNLPLMDIRADEYSRYVVKAGDLLVCEGGEVGRAAIVPEIAGTFGYQKALHRLRALNDEENKLFMYFTLVWATKTGVFDLGGSSTIAHLTGEQLRKYRFPRPPLVEQITIVDFLSAETAKLNTLTAEAQRAIDLLQERRSALISAAVTGQIDVRGTSSGEKAH